ncbi:MAG: T9SS type A sorting domain-containing protein [candidate division Zixibacteria bacterium]|nr:T9SS type A sorting domain-containing protein [candidate division Zixibacteria bacterium]
MSKKWFNSSLIIVFICGLASLAFGNQSVTFDNSKTGIEILSQDEMGVTLQIDVGHLDFVTTNTPEGAFSMIIADGFAHSQNIGEPNLPTINRLLSIPFGSEISVDVLSKEYEEISLTGLGITDPIIPTQPSLSKSTDPEDVPFEYNRSVYQQSGFYSLPLTTSRVVGTMRSVHLGFVSIAPFEYSPTENILRVNKHVTVRVNYLHPDFATTQRMQEKYYSPMYESVYQRLINYEAPSSELLDDLVTYPIKYLIIADPMFRGYLDDFIAWKTKKGFDVVVGYTDIIGSNNTEIKAYIQDLYENPPDGVSPSFVLLVGDSPQIQPFNGDGGSHITDLRFCEFTGDDIPEIYYGRFSAQSTGELQPQIDKTLQYEQYTMPDPSYLSDVTLIAGVDGTYAATHGNGQINYGTNNYFNMAHGIYSNVWLYPDSDSSGAAADIIETVDDGLGFLNYTAHCGHSGFSDPSFEVSDILTLTNQDMYLLAVGNCCLSNTFDESTPCFGEAWLQTPNRGGVGYLGGSNNTYWDEDYWWGVGYGDVVPSGPDYSETGIGAYDGAFHDHGEPVTLHYTTNMAINFAGNMAVTESGSSYEQYYWEIYHLMGDPSVMNYMGVPSENDITHANVIQLIATSFNIRAEPGSYVGISKDGVLHGADYVDESGVVDVPITSFGEPGYADIVITAQNKIPYEVSIPIIADGYGAITGNVTDLVTTDGLPGTVTVTNRDPQISASCNEDGLYILHVPSDTLWDLRADYTSDYLPSFAQVLVTEDDTVVQDFALEPKVEIILRASFGNPGEISYRTFYLRGSWDDDGFYDAAWSANFSPMKDDGVAPDQIAGDGIFTGSVKLATDASNTYSWAICSENYNGTASLIQNGADFDITDPGNPPTIPVLSVNPTGSEHNWTMTAEDISGYQFDLSPGYMGSDQIWFVNLYMYAGYTYQYRILAMRSTDLVYGVNGVGGNRINFTPAENGNYTIYFNDDSDLASTGASLEVLPAWLEVDLAPGGSTTRQIVLNNTGELDIDFIIPDDFSRSNSEDLPILPLPFASYEYTGTKPLSNTTPPGPPVTTGQGGPDEYGYKWIDSDESGGPTYEWIDISDIGTPISLSDDQNSGPYSLPFYFKFYGTDFNNFRVCSNGWLSFTSTATTYSNYTLPGTDCPENLIAPFLDDLNPSQGGQVYYHVNSERAVISWEGVPHYYNEGSYTFQIVLYNGGMIRYNYQTMSGELASSTIGIQNASQDDGLQVAYNTSYVHDNLSIKLSAGWLEVDPMNGSIPAGSSTPITVTLDASALAVGDYAATIKVQAWDALHNLPETEIPIDLHVMGSLPDLTLAMHPAESPVQTPAGGSFDFTLMITNNTGSHTVYDGWTMVGLPGGGMYGPVVQGTLGINAGQTQIFYASQDIPMSAAPGNYSYHAYVGDYPSTQIDHASFPFSITSLILGNGATDWNLRGFGSDLLSSGDDTNLLPTEYSLSQNYPNPFNAKSVIKYALPSDGKVELSVFNLLGQKVETLINSHQDAGYHTVTWDASHYSSGIYFYKLQVNNKQFTKRMTLIK